MALKSGYTEMILDPEHWARDGECDDQDHKAAAMHMIIHALNDGRNVPVVVRWREEDEDA